MEAFMNSLVTMSNFVGRTIDITAELGFSGILIAGHMGKLVKIGNGIMNTHSREGGRPHGHDAVLCVIRRNRRSGTFKKDPGIQHDG